MYRHKIVFLGDMKSGKTALIERATRNEFTETYTPTDGISFDTDSIDTDDYSLNLVDISGNPDDASALNEITQDAHAYVYCVDLSKPFDQETKNKIRTAIESARTKNPTARFFMVGTKLDLYREQNMEAAIARNINSMTQSIDASQLSQLDNERELHELAHDLSLAEEVDPSAEEVHRILASIEEEESKLHEKIDEEIRSKLDGFAKELNCAGSFITSAQSGENIASLLTPIHQQAAEYAKSFLSKTPLAQILNLIPEKNPLHTALVELQDAIIQLTSEQRNKIAQEAEDLIIQLSTTTTPEAKLQAIQTFEANCRAQLPNAESNPHESYALKALTTVAIIATATVIAITMGFAAGLALGLWAGPFSFFTGVAMGQVAATAVIKGSVAIGLVTGTSFNAYHLFSNPASKTKTNNPTANNTLEALQQVVNTASNYTPDDDNVPVDAPEQRRP